MNNWKKNIIVFVSGQMVSLFGSALVQYAITWYITLETKSGSMMMLSILCGFVPQIFLAPFAGVWADRLNRKKLIVYADSGIAVASMIVAFLFAFGYRQIWILLVVSAIRSLGSAIHSPAVSAAYPKMVPADQLMRVHGITSGIQSASMIIAPIIAGALLTFAPIEVIFSIDFFTALIAVTTVIFWVQIPKPEKQIIDGKIDYLSDMKMGLKYIRNHSFLVPFFVLCCIVWFFISPVSFLTPLQVARTYGEEVWRLSALEIAFSVGMTFGGLLVAAIGGFKNRIVTMGVSLILISVLTIGLGVVENFPVYLGILVVQGLTIPFYNTPATVMLQEKVDPEYMGRVFSVMGMLSSSVMPIGMLLFGPISDAVEIRWILVVCGVVLVLVAICVLMSKKFVQNGLTAKKEVKENLEPLVQLEQ